MDIYEYLWAERDSLLETGCDHEHSFEELSNQFIDEIPVEEWITLIGGNKPVFKVRPKEEWDNLIGREAQRKFLSELAQSYSDQASQIFEKLMDDDF